MRIALMRAILGFVALGELVWSLAFYFEPAFALGLLGRAVLDPVIERQYPLYVLSTALAYGLAVADPIRFRGIVWIAVANRAVEIVVGLLDWRAGAIATSSFAWLLALETATLLALVFAAGRAPARRADAVHAIAVKRDDRGLQRLLRAFGGLQLFWFLASTLFVQVGAGIFHWTVKDPYTTQQQGVALLIIGLTSLVAGSDPARYRVFVWVPVASQLIGVANSFNEIHLGVITWSAAAIQWSIQLGIVAAFAYFSRASLSFSKPATSLDAR